MRNVQLKNIKEDGDAALESDACAEFGLLEIPVVRDLKAGVLFGEGANTNRATSDDQGRCAIRVRRDLKAGLLYGTQKSQPVTEGN